MKYAYKMAKQQAPLSPVLRKLFRTRVSEQVQALLKKESLWSPAEMRTAIQDFDEKQLSDFVSNILEMKETLVPQRNS